MVVIGHFYRKHTNYPDLSIYMIKGHVLSNCTLIQLILSVPFEMYACDKIYIGIVYTDYHHKIFII